jgi:PAS domain S-box-containing protein
MRQKIEHTSISEITERPPLFLRRLLLIALVTDILFAGHACFWLYHSKLRYEKHAEVITQNLCFTLAAHISDTVDKIDLTVLTVADEVEKQLAGGGIDEQRLNAFIARHHARLPDLGGLRVVNAQGENAYGIAVNPGTRTSVADRAYFIRLKGDPGAGLVVSEPVVGRVSKQWSIIFARRVNQPDGSFAGVVYGTITLEHFISTFSSIDVGKHGAITLRGEELALIARYPQPADFGEVVGKKNASPELQRSILASKHAGTYRSSKSFDIVQRTYSYHKVSSQPLYVVVGMAPEDYLAAWQSEASWITSLVAIFILGTILSSWLIYRGWIRRTRAVQALEFQERALLESEDRLRTVTNHAPVLLAQCDREGRYTFVNEQYAQFFQKNPADILGKHIREIQGEKTHARSRQHVAEVLAGRPTEYDLTVAATAHGMRTLHASYAPERDASDQVIGFVAALVDVTERKLLEDQLRQAQKMEAIGQLAGGVAHDFNNIMAATMLQLSFLQRNKSLDPEAQEMLKELMMGAKRAASLTSQLLMFSRRSILEIKVLDLNEVIAHLLKMLGRLIGEHISLQFVPGEVLPPVEADARMVEQVVMNLAVNARDAMPKGGLLTIKLEPFLVDAERVKDNVKVAPGPFVCLSVTDTGCGMDEATLKHIFEPFFTTKDVGKGTGLGLAAVHGIMAQHKGWVDVESEPGKGSTFKVFFPARTKGPAEPAATGTLDVMRGQETILLVEDEASLRRLVAQGLRLLGYQVFDADNGRTAMKLWRKHGRQIDLLFSDMVMPEGMTGLELAEMLKREKPGLKVILSSGYNVEMAAQSLSAAGSVLYLQKPYEVEVLSQMVRDCLDGGKKP